MLFYILLFVSAYLSFKEFRKPKQRRLLFLGYTAIVAVALAYNLGEVAGEVIYNLGVSI